MDIKFCQDKKEWDEFLLQNSKSFLQSFEWGNLQEKSVKNILRIKVEENNETLVQAQVTIESFFSKNYFYIAFGPVFKKNIDPIQRTESLKVLLKKIKEKAKKENCIFLRIEPVVEVSDAIGKKAQISPRRIQPKKTLILDLTQTEEDLFKKFSRTTKYNIGLAKRSGVKIKEQQNYSPDFYKLLEKTKNRQEFGIYPESHYKDIFEISSESIKVELFTAEYKGKIINATIVLFFNGRATTLHSGSDYNHRSVKGSNLLNWEIILSAKKRGLEELDFWGIDENKWPSLTFFKKGFDGKEVEYPEGIDIVFQSFWYNIYKISRFIKKII